MTTSTQGAIASEVDLHGELVQLRRNLLATLIYAVPLLSWCWFLAVLIYHREVGPGNIPPAILGFSAYGVHRLRAWRQDLASWALLLAAIVVECLAAMLYPASRLLVCGALAIPIAQALLGSAQSLLVTLALWAAAALGGYLAGDPLAWGRGAWDILVFNLLTWGAAWLAARPLHTSIDWALSGWKRATQALEETRERRAEVYRALRALEEATGRIERMNAELIVARREAEEARVLKARFAAAVSHELRGPLSLVLGFSQMIALSPERYGVPLPQAYQPDVDTIYRNSQHLVALVDDILDLSRIEADRLPLVKDRVDIEEDVVKKVAVIVEPLAQRKGLGFHLELAGDLPWILADSVRLRQALLNLVANAVRVTEQGAVTVRTQKDETSVLVSVTDTGPGIAPEEMRKLFQEFSQVWVTERRAAAGSGLGLSISKHLVELHGGHIWADSTPGAGTTFCFSLPLPGMADGAARFASSEPTRHQFATESCLVVHSDPAIVRLLSRYIEDYRVIGLPNEQEVLALTADLHPRAIITTPALETAIRRLLEPAPFDVPIITCGLPCLTDWTDIKGILGYLIKPINGEMVAAVMRRLEQSRAAPAGTVELGDGRRLERPPDSVVGRSDEMTILLVDDDPDAVRLLERMLTAVSHPYHILKASDGLEALRIMQETVPDVVFMDLFMPVLDGKETIRRMQEDDRLRAVAVIVVSARDWIEGEATLETPISVRMRGPVEIGRGTRSLKAVLDCLEPRYLPDAATGVEPAAAYRP